MAITSRRCARSCSQEGSTWIAHYDVDAGPAIKIASVDLRITGAGATDPRFREVESHFPVQKGEVLHHPEYEQGKKLLTDLAAEEGYLDATFQENQVRVDLERYQADVVLHYTPARATCSARCSSIRTSSIASC